MNSASKQHVFNVDSC